MTPIINNYIPLNGPLFEAQSPEASRVRKICRKVSRIALEKQGILGKLLGYSWDESRTLDHVKSTAEQFAASVYEFVSEDSIPTPGSLKTQMAAAMALFEKNTVGKCSAERKSVMQSVFYRTCLTKYVEQFVTAEHPGELTSERIKSLVERLTDSFSRMFDQKTVEKALLSAFSKRFPSTRLNDLLASPTVITELKGSISKEIAGAKNDAKIAMEELEEKALAYKNKINTTHTNCRASLEQFKKVTIRYVKCLCSVHRDIIQETLAEHYLPFFLLAANCHTAEFQHLLQRAEAAVELDTTDERAIRERAQFNDFTGLSQLKSDMQAFKKDYESKLEIYQRALETYNPQLIAIGGANFDPRTSYQAEEGSEISILQQRIKDLEHASQSIDALAELRLSFLKSLKENIEAYVVRTSALEQQLAISPEGIEISMDEELDDIAKKFEKLYGVSSL